MDTAAANAKKGNNNNSKSKGGKTKTRRNERNILTFYEKIAVIRYYDETNISRNSLAKMFHCCATQIRRILEKKRELLQQLATLSEADASIIIEEMTRKRRKFEMSAISFLLHEWVERCRQLRLGVSIRNQTLKDTALRMAAVLKLPAFRPSYRWLNRFRSKYKYEDDELGYTGPNPVANVLPLEQIILEFKHALPNFMQKELADIDMDNKLSAVTPELVNLSSENSEISDGEDLDDDGVEMLTCEPSVLHSPATSDGEDESLPMPQQQPEEDASMSLLMNAGSCSLLSNVFPHLAIIHQFALINSDVQALELISQLGVHMQQQATAGAYQILNLPTNGEAPALPTPELPPGSIYADIDDIELIE
ncbi:PREDICTED: uncharacterized protein LOC108614110 [Drosophila arizonae]|uniref:Uncharacterized protein LOC108614110 n=1 Tax=Drosophila arizonae TaxID=7263 RepID=A0ABM1P8J9_DROAR|nr:PREDICTED: uncharacterized protein LOC108614110 [Drosophila arizonae]XP_017863536.1 PREDICTED: uncharacterized protein LOC108614110 [Drosophila arizonae]XP_017863537.1 PREDICTED: uncharacterized protein LOC108614110 [Drosophila arizonae]XP_017863538.1 PREDICTED: uncharacterized protein LOC108614110 [Drosophila arizonae]